MDLIAIGNGGAGNGLAYKFVPLPIVQTDADTDSYVVDAVGAAGTNLTGAGLGLTGSDLVLTQYNNVGTDGTNRTIANMTYQCLKGTYGLYSALYNSSRGFSIVHRVKDLYMPSAGYSICNLYLFDSGSGILRYGITPELVGKVVAAVDSSLGIGISSKSGTDMAGEESAYMMILSMDYQTGLCFSGIKVDDGLFPTSLDEMVLFSINQLDPITAPTNPLTTCLLGNGSSEANAICGDRSTSYTTCYSGGHTIVSVTMSAKPCLVAA